MVAALWTLRDLQTEFLYVLSSINLTRSQLEETLPPEKMVEFFASLPFIGRVTEITYLRTRNPQDVWVNHDLNDLMYAVCAAGYADYVAADNKFAALLNKAAKNTTPGAVVVSNLRSLRTHLERQGA